MQFPLGQQDGSVGKYACSWSLVTCVQFLEHAQKWKQRTKYT